MSRVVVLGATGELGHRVVAWLRELCPEVEVVGASRSGRGDAGVPVRPVDVLHASSLRGVLDGVAVAVNAVGPYDWDPHALVGGCVESGCHYVDLAESRSFSDAVRIAAERHDAAGAGVAVAGGCSTMPGLVEVLARHAAPAEAQGLEAWLSMGSRNPVSPGLLAGLLRPLGRAHAGGRWFDHVEVHRIGERSLSFASYPTAWPEDGVVVGDRRLPISFRMGFDRAWITRALSLASRVLGRLPESALPRLVPVLLPLVQVARPFGTPLGALAVRALDAGGAEVGRVEVHASARGLDVPALPAAWAVRALVSGRPTPVGAIGLADLVSAAEAVAALGDAGYAVISNAPLAGTPEVSD